MLVIVLLFLLYILWWYYTDNKKYEGLPPGPRRYPFVGNLIQIALLCKTPVQALYKLSRKYGDIMLIRFGIVDMLVISTYATVKELQNMDDLQYAAQVNFAKNRNDNKNVGIMLSNDEVWQTMRRYTIRTLRDFGFGKSSLNSVIQEEANKLVKYIHHRKLEDGTVLDVESLFDLSAVNVIWSMVSGKAANLDDERLHELLRVSREAFKSARFDDTSIAYPFVSSWFPEWSGKSEQTQKTKSVLVYLQQLIDEHSLTKDNSEPKCLIDCFLSQLGETLFTTEQLLYVLLDLFQAGSDTTSNTLAFSILYMIVHPEKQEKVFQELSLSDTNIKKALPYTNATILECLRYSTVVPFYPVRQASSNIALKGYKIPKGIHIMFSAYSIHFDENVWGDPLNFRPERFLRDGEVDKTIAEKLLPFGAGKRECLGRRIAEDTLFVFFTTLLRNFQFQMHKDDRSLNIEPRLGITMSPYPYRCVITPRV